MIGWVKSPESEAVNCVEVMVFDDGSADVRNGEFDRFGRD